MPSLTNSTAMRLLNSVVSGTHTAEQQDDQPEVLQQQQQDQQEQELEQQATIALNHSNASTSTSEDRIESLSSNSSTSSILTSHLPLISNIVGNTSAKSHFSIHSNTDFMNSCRICRWNRSDMKVIRCPCNCKGSVGYIHLKCLRRWVMHRRDNRCEICNAPFEITEERASFKQMMRTFWCARCFGLIVKHLVFSFTLMPLAYVILQQVLQCMDNLNQSNPDQLSIQEVFVASCALLTSSALFFHYFEFATTRFILIRNVLRHWWLFGSTSDFSLIDFDEDTMDFF